MAYTIPFYSSTTSRFGETAGRTNPHRGHDVAPGGQAFPSWVNGTVVTAGYQSCLGNRVVVQNDDDGYYIGVSHLAEIWVSVGQRVSIGTSLGVIGNTGSCSAGRHAHITVSPSSAYPESGAVIDPVTYANGAPGGGGGGGSAGYGWGLSSQAQLALQRAMSHTSRYTGPHDGAFGPNSVAGMQQWLKDLGYLVPSYVVDGEPGTGYGEALQLLARDKGGYTGPIDGYPGTATSEALIYWAEVVVIQNGGGSSGTYGYGLTMEAQRQIQAALTYSGHYTGPIDGVFGPSSVSAMQKYLKDVGLLSEDYGIDGEPGSIYGAALQHLAAQHGYTGAIDGQPGDQTSLALIGWANWLVTGGFPKPEEPEEPEEPLPPGAWPETGTFGIDVASPQRDIDFKRAKADGAEFVIIKMGGLNVRPQYVAPYYKNQVDRARAEGLAIGHYYLIGLGQTPEEQARFFVDNLHDFRQGDVLAIDNEKLDSNGTRWDDDPAARFIREVYRLTGIIVQRRWHYAGANDYRTHKPWTEVEKVARIWWAAYGDNEGVRDHDPDIRGAVAEVDVHQFGSKVKIAGYELDGNWSPLEFDELFAVGVPDESTEPDPTPDPEPEPECPPERLDDFIEELRALMELYGK